MKSIVIISDSSVPYQPYIGRGEAMTAVYQILNGSTDDTWLAAHNEFCIEIVDLLAKRRGPNLASSINHAASRSLWKAADTHLNAQGSSITELEAHVARISEQRTLTLLAEDDGYPRYYLRHIRNALVQANQLARGDRRNNNTLVFPDVAGIRLLAKPWEKLKRGDPVFQIRSGLDLQTLDLSSLYSINREPCPVPNIILEAVVD
ncbi:hypothetical protein [Gordonia polyisoprenivorans]|uniref:hypothetical protein n=1 Tax=Gordonia polyisoprenivorans TaxID=84595 RepID=UPI0011D243CB|nr:hypothetical protein [Gordonia polyisoprenivorans]